MRDNKGRFVPGNPGGPGRKTKEHSITTQLRNLSEEVDKETGKTRAQLLAEKMWSMALDEDDRQVITQIVDRLDGKAKERHEISQVEPTPIVVTKDEGDE
jgi:hypothetical protein